MNKLFYFLAFLVGVAFFFGVAFGLSFGNDWKLSIGETTSLFIAALAMIATSYQAWATRKHNRLQVQPLIMLEYPMDAKPTIDGTHHISCRFHNIGLGPADVSAIKLILNEKQVSSQELMDVLWNETGINSLYQQHKINCEGFAVDLANGAYIKEGQTFTLASIKFWPEQSDKKANYTELSSAYTSAVDVIRKKLRIQAKYSSVYKDESKKIDSHDFQMESQ